MTDHEFKASSDISLAIEETTSVFQQEEFKDGVKRTLRFPYLTLTSNHRHVLVVSIVLYLCAGAMNLMLLRQGAIISVD